MALLENNFPVGYSLHCMQEIQNMVEVDVLLRK